MRLAAAWMGIWLSGFPAAAVQDGPQVRMVAEFDEVWGPACIEALEKGLRRLDGVVTAKEGRDKWHYDVTVKEGKALLPAHLEKMLQEMKKSSGGDLDFPLLGLVVSGLSGKVAREGDVASLEARGSGQKYRLTGDAGLKGLLDSGKTQLTLSGKLTQSKGGLPALEVTDAKDSTK